MREALKERGLGEVEGLLINVRHLPDSDRFADDGVLGSSHSQGHQREDERDTHGRSAGGAHSHVVSAPQGAMLGIAPERRQQPMSPLKPTGPEAAGAPQSSRAPPLPPAPG